MSEDYPVRCPKCRSYVGEAMNFVDGKQVPPYAIGCSNEECSFWATETSGEENDLTKGPVCV